MAEDSAAPFSFRLSTVKTSLDILDAMSSVELPGQSKSELLGNLDELPPCRQGLVRILERRSVEMLLGGCIVFNMLLIILETDASVGDADVAGWVTIMNYVLLGIYTVELLLRLVAYRCHFFRSGWNILDLAIISSDLILLAVDLVIGNMPKVTVLRAFRLVRLARSFKALSIVPELALLLSGFVSAITAIFWGMSLILIVITIWAILAVQLIHPINEEVKESGLYERSGCERCPHAFESVFEASLTIFQASVAGDSWGMLALPIIETNPLAGVFFLFVLVSISLAIMNLILAVIVERAQDVKDESLARVAAEKHSEFKQAAVMLEKMCATLDRDDNEVLTKEELLRGFEFRDFAEIMATIGLRARDIDTLFAALDEDDSGDIHYAEFVGQLFRLKNPDLHFITMELLNLKQRMAKIMRTVIKDVSCANSTQVHSFGGSLQNYGNSTGVLAEVRDDREKESVACAHQKSESSVQEASSMQHSQVSAAKVDAAQDHRHEPHDAMSELAASVRSLVRHSELQSKILGNICDMLMTSPSGQSSHKPAVGAFRQRPLACMPGKSPPVEGWQALSSPNVIGQPNEPIMLEQAPRATMPKSSLETSQMLLRVPPHSTRRHLPMYTPRGYSPRNPSEEL